MLDALRAELAQVKSDLAWRRLRDALARKYSPNQPRVPAGSGRESGRWTSGSGGSSGGGFSRPFGVGDEEVEDGGQLDEIVVDGADVNPDFDGAGESFDSSDGSRVAAMVRPTTGRLQIVIRQASPTIALSRMPTRRRFGRESSMRNLKIGRDDILSI